ncbi:hypothetical protein LTR09_002842 [Extremus antarcticus]|uniref:Cytochrome b561 domain-containing protein n=1 Tax=Extremus antarcticus TaxID=702011 RepID=A0AAJ0GF67_9PEZI|nr:hypothetical protein LTR09_002842 [Extremus antarcticus]
MQRIARTSLVLALGKYTGLGIQNAYLRPAASVASAQFGGPPSGSPSGGNPYTDGGSDDGSTSGRPGFGSGEFGVPKNINTMITAHAVLATLAFGLFFPFGSIIIRLGSFRGLWLVHGIIQSITYVLFVAAAAIGVYMARHIPRGNVLLNAHPIIGLLLLLLLFFQPFLGLIHHFAFKKHSRRVVWSYAHIWLGRFVITLGIINGGLGLQLSKRLGMFAPTQGAVIGYAVGAGIMWLLYVASAIYGEKKRSKANYAAVNQGPPPYKLERGSESGEVRYA